MSEWLEGVQYAENIGAKEALRQIACEFDEFMCNDFVAGMIDYALHYQNVLQPLEKEKEQQHG